MIAWTLKGLFYSLDLKHSGVVRLDRMLAALSTAEWPAGDACTPGMDQIENMDFSAMSVGHVGRFAKRTVPSSTLLLMDGMLAAGIGMGKKLCQCGNGTCERIVEQTCCVLGSMVRWRLEPNGRKCFPPATSNLFLPQVRDKPRVSLLKRHPLQCTST